MTAKAAGSVTITVASSADNTKSATCSVVVGAAEEPTRHGYWYVSQIGSPGYTNVSSHFRKEYWSPYSSKSGCAVASTAMTLDIMGDRKLPSEIIKKNGETVSMTWRNHGYSYSDKTTSAVTDLDDCIAKHNGNPSKYACPIIRVTQPKGGYHFLVILNKNSDNSYNALDPAYDSENAMTFKGADSRYTSYNRLIQYYK